jgi:hypothetical protein
MLAGSFLRPAGLKELPTQFLSRVQRSAALATNVAWSQNTPSESHEY